MRTPKPSTRVRIERGGMDTRLAPPPRKRSTKTRRRAAVVRLRPGVVGRLTINHVTYFAFLCPACGSIQTHDTIVGAYQRAVRHLITHARTATVRSTQEADTE